MVHALIRLAGTLQLDIVAEGVEHEEQVRRLVELGCDQIQGFCFSKPVAPGAIEDLLQRDEPAGPSYGATPAATVDTVNTDHDGTRSFRDRTHS